MNLKEIHPECLLVKELVGELQKCDPEGEVRFVTHNHVKNGGGGYF